MKRILAISLSLAMVFALFGAMTVSVSAEDIEWSVFKSADNGDTPAIADSKCRAAISTVQNTFDSISSEKMWKYSMNDNGQYYNSAIRFTFEAGTLSDVQDIRLWAAIDGLTDSSKSAKFDLVFITGNSAYSLWSIAISTTGSTVSVGTKALKVCNTSTIQYGCYTGTINGSTTFSAIAKDITAIQIQSRQASSGIWSATNHTAYFDKIEIAKPAAAPSDPTVTMASGAAMRIDGTTDGIRFEATVDKTAFDNLVGNATVTEIGTLIAKAGADISKVVVENAVDTSTGAMELAEGKIPVAKYAAGTTMQDVAGTDKYVIYGSLVEIKPDNANQQYVARAYVKYTDSTGSHVLYASALSEARSIAQVAKAIVDANDSYYTSLCEDHKAVVDFWANQYVAQ